jgi:hypothetical protein
MNPADKQYFQFSIVISIIISFLINFILLEFLRGTLVYGIPFNLNEAEGFGGFILKLLNTTIVSAILVFPMYLILKELNRRR